MKTMYYADKRNNKVWKCLLEGYNGYGALGKKAKIHVEYIEGENISMLVPEKTVFSTESEAQKAL